MNQHREPMTMRTAILVLGALLLASCVVVPPPPNYAQSYDPRLYDAAGNIVAPVAAAPAPAPECREVERTVEIGGKQQQAYALACRQPDGTWRFTN